MTTRDAALAGRAATPPRRRPPRSTWWPMASSVRLRARAVSLVLGDQDREPLPARRTPGRGRPGPRRRWPGAPAAASRPRPSLRRGVERSRKPPPPPGPGGCRPATRMCSRTRSSGQARRYGRSWLSASQMSTAAKIRAASGISSPREPARVAGPVPLLVVAVGDLQGRPEEVDRREPSRGRSVGWRRITAHSSSVSGPGFRRMASGTPILPMSCSSAPRRTCTSSASAEPHGPRQRGRSSR